jgi:hypothetical protein
MNPPGHPPGGFFFRLAVYALAKIQDGVSG